MQISYKVLCGITLLAISYVSYGILPLSVQDLHPFSLLRVLNYILLVTVLLFAILDRLYSRVLRVCIAFIIVGVLLGLLLLAFGWVQDMLGTVCPGFMEPRGPCTSSVMWLGIFLVSTVYVPGTIILAVVLIFGMIDEAQRRKGLSQIKPSKT